MKTKTAIIYYGVAALLAGLCLPAHAEKNNGTNPGSGVAVRNADITRVCDSVTISLDFVLDSMDVRSGQSTVLQPLFTDGTEKVWLPAVEVMGRRRYIYYERNGCQTYAEGEVLGTLLNNIDASDLRVNQVDAFVIPESRIVMRGSSYTANIVLAAVDTTQRPRVFVNGTRLDNDRGLYQASTSRSGNFDYSGYIEVAHGDGTTSQHSFKSSYTVIDPTATISATMMNVLYAGIDNPLSIAVPGIPSNAISASMTNGSLTRNGDVWAAHPDKVGTEAVVTVTATIDGRRQTVATTNFRVRKLPDPMPYIAYTDSKGNPERYRGGKPFAKSLLLQTDGIGAAIDDDMLNVAYRVLGFETVFFDSMGNAIPEVSDGDKFSDRQKSSFRRLARGKRFYISRVRAIGPDGIERTLAPIEVIVN